MFSQIKIRNGSNLAMNTWSIISIIIRMEEEFGLEHENDFEDQDLKIASSCSIEGICDEPHSTKQFSCDMGYSEAYSSTLLNQLTSIFLVIQTLRLRSMLMLRNLLDLLLIDLFRNENATWLIPSWNLKKVTSTIMRMRTRIKRNLENCMWQTSIENIFCT